VRLDGYRWGKICSRARVLAAIMLLTIFGAAALKIDVGSVNLQAGNHGNSPQLFASNPIPSAQAPSSQARRQAFATFSHLPLMFEPNQGQTDPRVSFLARGSGYGLYLTKQEAVLVFKNSAADARHSASSVVSMKLVGATSTADPVGDGELPGKSNYFIGNDPAKWHRDIPQFSRVRYRDVYPGVDLVYYGNQGRLEYDFEVAPSGDPAQLALKFQGVEAHNLRIDANGDLVLAIGGNDLRLLAPRVYQNVGAEQRIVEGRFELRGKQKEEVGFKLGSYDRKRSLIIDPVLTYSTYLGGSGSESCSTITGLPFTPGCPAIAVDSASNAYVAGSTTSTDFPATAGEYQPDLAPGATANVFISKFTPTGSLQFSTYLGGNRLDYTAGIGVDTGFDILVAGTTSSADFPTTDGTSNTAFQTAPLSGGQHVFVSKLDPTGKILMYSTYLSGTGVDIASGLAVDSGGNANVIGTTTSTEVGTGFPSTLGSFQPLPAAANQFFFTRVNPNTSGALSVPYSTYFGGASPSNGVAVGGGIAVDGNSNVYLTGGTSFTDMPVLNAYQSINEGGLDIFVAKINPSGVTGSQLLFSTYLGGSGNDVGYGIAVDSTPNAYITGSTSSTDFNVTGTTGSVLSTALQSTNGGGTDAFIAKLGTPCSGTGCTTFVVPLTYFSYLGGAGTDVATSITVDNNSGARIAGWTNSPNFPIVGNPLQVAYGGGSSDAFFADLYTDATCSPLITPGCTATDSTSYFGGSGADLGTGLALDLQGANYMTGETASATGFPLKNPVQGALSGTSDAFVSKLAPVLNLIMLPPTATPLVVGVGSQVSFAYTITNSGEFTNNVTFVDYLPASGASFVSATTSPGSCGTPTNNTVLCNIGTLNAAANATVTVIETPVAATLAGCAPGNSVSLGNSGSAFVGQAILATASASVTVNDYSLCVSPASATVPAGVPAIFTATVTPSSNTGFPDSVSIACGGGLPTGATCVPGNNNPIPNLNTGAQSSQLIINTTTRVTTTTDLRHENGPRAPLYATLLPVSGLALLGIGLTGKLSRRRRLLIGSLLAGLFTFILLLPACHTAATVSTTTGTPAGTYSVTVNATSGNATRSTLVTLVVQ
jgi:hypothetical protein